MGGISTFPSGSREYLQTFLSSGTFVVPVGIQVVEVFLVGGGGGGGAASQDGSNAQAFTAGGGGGGGQVVSWTPIAVVGGASISAGIGGGEERAVSQQQLCRYWGPREGLLSSGP